ncbi:aminoacyl-tRNA deacylase [Thermosphaera chiliense]|uniref:Aminoacyl-tRNA deacylase n=1 Tax=Thermosphaera chiliense TaxID=3402707 RepID=A0A7M1UQM9_9CREN|nr:aminoacyl-tRNA deacylase [Thermosphaera aggregans]QOR94501.1 aminoacyl-tRNA deacylase [Thermosphaera aggregans]
MSLRGGTESLRRLLEEKGVWHRLYEFPEHTATVEAAVKQLGVDPGRIVKTLVLVDEEGKPLAAIIPGNKRLSLDKLSSITGRKLRLARAREVEKATGYPVGAVPPVGHGLKTYVDREVLNRETVIGGGGSTHSLLELKTRDLLALTQPVVSDIAE